MTRKSWRVIVFAFLLAMAVMIPALANGDATADFVLLPSAIGLLTTREKVM